MTSTPHLVYPSVDLCIYCGSTTSLGKEHIVPFGLYGRMVLPNSSCNSCASITGKFEAYCLRKMFNPIRSKYGVPPRKKDKPRPTHYEVISAKPSGSHIVPDSIVQIIRTPVDDHPTVLFLYQYGLPDILAGREPATIYREARPWQSHVPKDKVAEFAKKYNAERIYISEFDPQLFGRLLAKIAHSYAVGEIGYGHFTPYLNEVILHGSDSISYWTGGNKEIPPPTPGNSMHVLTLWYQLIPGSTDSHVVVTVRLFSNMGTPEYYVVVGSQTEEQRSRTESSPSPALTQ